METATERLTRARERGLQRGVTVLDGPSLKSWMTRHPEYNTTSLSGQAGVYARDVRELLRGGYASPRTQTRLLAAMRRLDGEASE